MYGYTNDDRPKSCIWLKIRKLNRVCLGWDVHLLNFGGKLSWPILVYESKVIDPKKNYVHKIHHVNPCACFLWTVHVCVCACLWYMCAYVHWYIYTPPIWLIGPSLILGLTYYAGLMPSVSSRILLFKFQSPLIPVALAPHHQALGPPSRAMLCQH